MSASNYEGLYIKQHLCANFLFDLNGNKGPNTFGKDIGIIAAIYSSDSNVVMPVPARKLSATYKHSDAGRACTNSDNESRLPNIEELLTLYYNANLLGNWLVDDGYRWSSTVNDASNAWAFGNSMGVKYSRPKDSLFAVQCVKR